jgi:mono/diheme cytochrome c family protein
MAKMSTWRRSRVLRLTVYGVVGVLGLVMVAVGTAYAMSAARLSKRWDVEPVPLAVRPSADLAEKGEAIATYRGCIDCHGEDFGGRVFIDAMPVMRLVAPNITPGGVTADYTDEDWARAIRHGVRPDRSPILFMPSQEWTELSHEDLAALIAFLRSVPPVDRTGEESSVGIVGRALYLTGQLPLVPAEIVDHRASPASPTPGPTAAYGAYLISACTGCHGEHLSGGPIPGVPPDWPAAANLTAHESGLANWTEADFIEAMRTGRTPSGRTLPSDYMPWPFLGQSSDDDLRALYLHLRSLEPRAFGGR